MPHGSFFSTRAFRTFAETALAYVGTGAVAPGDVNIASVAANAANDTSIKDPVQTVLKGLDALKEYTAKAEKHIVEKAPVVG